MGDICLAGWGDSANGGTTKDGRLRLLDGWLSMVFHRSPPVLIGWLASHSPTVLWFHAKPCEEEPLGEIYVFSELADHLNLLPGFFDHFRDQPLEIAGFADFGSRQISFGPVGPKIRLMA